jgi:outer membrane protein, heavy metal efflux system
MKHQHTPSHSFPLPLAPAAVAFLLLLSSCVHLDHKGDVQKAAENVRDRAGYIVPWDEPWAKDTRWDGVAPLTVDQAVLAALTNNGDIRALVEHVAASRADLAQAGLLPNPVVSVRVRIPLDGGAAISPVGISVTQSFVALWLRSSRLEAADARLNQSILTLSDSALRLVAQVKAAHAEIVFGQRSLALAEAHVERCELALGAVDRAAATDESTALGAGRLRQALRVAESGVLQRRLDLDRQRRSLLFLMGVSRHGDSWSAVDHSVCPDPCLYPPALPASMDDNAAWKLALDQRLDVAASMAVVEANKKDLTTEERNRFRDLGVGVILQETHHRLNFLGLENSVPLFDFNQAQIAKAGSMGRAALATAEAVVERAIMEARVGFGEASATQALAKSFRENVLAESARNFEAALASVDHAADATSRDTTALLETLLDLAESEQAANDLNRKAAIARIELERAVGGSLSPTKAPAPAVAPAKRNVDPLARD